MFTALGRTRILFGFFLSIAILSADSRSGALSSIILVRSAGSSSLVTMIILPLVSALA